ncbi:hypothetical protein ACFL50_05255 [Candidatus Latescibacterota bacterium]
MIQTFLRKDRTVLFFFFFLFAVYFGIFIYKTSFVVDGTRYFSLFDDAMVSMRYARNLAAGNGLVMNPGERVEGITNPLWTVYMAAVHLLPVTKEKISLVIQISAAILLAFNLLFVMKIARLISKNVSAVTFSAVFLTAFYLPLINWSLQGMEVCVLTLLISIIVWRMLISLQSGQFTPSLYVLLGICMILRIDMVVPFAGIWVFLIKAQPENQTKNIIWGIVILMIFLVGQTVFRIVYYGEPLPNTYYLKMTGYPVLLRLSRGLIVLWQFIWSMNLFVFLVPVFVVIFACNQYTGLLALVVGLQMLYSVYVGGDAWEEWGGSNRYIAVIMPQFFILLSWGLYRFSGIVSEFLSGREISGSKTFAFVKTYSFALLVILSFIHLNSNSNSLTLKGFFFFDLPPYVANNKTMVERANLVKKITTPEARIAVTWAGIIPYFSERYTVDMLGKTDKTIARLNMRLAPENENKYTYFLPGHLKYDYEHSLIAKKPDIVLQFWDNIHESDEIIAKNYVKIIVGDLWVYALQGSKNVRWNLFPKN